MNDRDEAAWYSENSNGTAHPVGKKKANAWGLFDMRGNVSEWTWDGYDDLQADATDPIVKGTSTELTGSDRIIKGGSFYENFRSTRPAFRMRYSVDSSMKSLGFRPVRTK